jgi:methyl-accepting chemotaxis protein
LGVAVAVAIVASWLVAQRFARPLITLTHAAMRVSKGDLTVSLPDVRSEDEIGQLNRGFQAMVGHLKDLVSQIYATSETLTSASQTLAATAQETTRAAEHVSLSMEQIASGAESQIDSASQTAAATSEMAAGVQRIAYTTSLIANESTESKRNSDLGFQAIQTAVRQMQEIHDSARACFETIGVLHKRSQEIGEIIELIADIADQTNLLALNAAIEAARAGDQGKGFSVVANEVRKLAEESRLATERISQRIGQILSDVERSVASMNLVSEKVKDGLAAVEHAGRSFERIRSETESVANQIQSMYAETEEMSAKSQQISSAVAEMEQVAKETGQQIHNVLAASEEQLASMEEVSASANELSDIATKLARLIEQFHFESR